MIWNASTITTAHELEPVDGLGPARNPWRELIKKMISNDVTYRGVMLLSTFRFRDVATRPANPNPV